MFELAYNHSEQFCALLRAMLLPDFTFANMSLVDLMLETAGFSFTEAEGEIEHHEIEGVSIPFASARLLLKMKQTEREKDTLDRMFLERKIAEE